MITENVTVDGVIAPMDGWFEPTAQDDEMTGVSAYLNQVAKYVVSTSLDRADWRTARSATRTELDRRYLMKAAVEVIRQVR